ncbi:MAG: histidine phosphatase family protein [Cyclobacteriaceae bacterium]
MKTKKIYIIRHGQTDYNKRGIVQGSGIDAPLNDLGREQASLFYEAYKNLPFDKIYTSALIRTEQSVKGFIDLGISHQSMPELNEIHWGAKEGKPFSSNDHEEYERVTGFWSEGATHHAIAGGESPDQVMQRQKVALDHILSQPDESLILIAMHGRAIRIFLCLLLNCPLKKMDDFDHANLCLYQLTYAGGNFNLDNANCQKHLEGLGQDS